MGLGDSNSCQEASKHIISTSVKWPNPIYPVRLISNAVPSRCNSWFSQEVSSSMKFYNIWFVHSLVIAVYLVWGTRFISFPAIDCKFLKSKCRIYFIFINISFPGPMPDILYTLDTCLLNEWMINAYLQHGSSLQVDEIWKLWVFVVILSLTLISGWLPESPLQSPHTGGDGPSHIQKSHFIVSDFSLNLPPTSKTTCYT